MQSLIFPKVVTCESGEIKYQNRMNLSAPLFFLF
jgi:hypothetical protein